MTGGGAMPSGTLESPLSTSGNGNAPGEGFLTLYSVKSPEVQ